jgi:hypothetical protein
VREPGLRNFISNNYLPLMKEMLGIQFFNNNEQQNNNYRRTEI